MYEFSTASPCSAPNCSLAYERSHCIFRFQSWISFLIITDSCVNCMCQWNTTMPSNLGITQKFSTRGPCYILWPQMHTAHHSTATWLVTKLHDDVSIVLCAIQAARARFKYSRSFESPCIIAPPCTRTFLYVMMFYEQTSDGKGYVRNLAGS